MTLMWPNTVVTTSVAWLLNDELLIRVLFLISVPIIVKLFPHVVLVTGSRLPLPWTLGLVPRLSNIPIALVR